MCCAAEKAPSPSPLPSFSTTTVYGAMGWGASSCRRRGLDEMGWDGEEGERLLIRCANSALVGGRERAYKTLPSPTFILRRVARGGEIAPSPAGCNSRSQENEEKRGVGEAAVSRPPNLHTLCLSPCLKTAPQICPGRSGIKEFSTENSRNCVQTSQSARGNGENIPTFFIWKIAGCAAFSKNLSESSFLHLFQNEKLFSQSPIFSLAKTF